MKIRERLESVLKDLKSAGDVDGSAIVSRDGLLVASDLPPQVNAEAFVAMAATMVGAAETATAELGKGVIDRVIVESIGGKIIATGASKETLLVVMTNPNANLGLILYEMKKASKKIKEILEETT